MLRMLVSPGHASMVARSASSFCMYLELKASFSLLVCSVELDVKDAARTFLGKGFRPTSVGGWALALHPFLPIDAPKRVGNAG
eukprot:9632028-Lingulodinium_polyedra.AAC.1